MLSRRFYLLICLLIDLFLNIYGTNGSVSDESKLQQLDKYISEFFNTTKQLDFDDLEKFLVDLKSKLGSDLSEFGIDDQACLKEKIDVFSNRTYQNILFQHSYLDDVESKAILLEIDSNKLQFLNKSLTSLIKQCMHHGHGHNFPNKNETTSSIAYNNTSTYDERKLKLEKWIYSIVSAIIISVVGVMCIAVVPLMNTFKFNYLFQFLVALAVGTLSGDALLHLIPHVFSNHNHGQDDHDHGHDHGHGHSHDMSGIYKGLGAMAGIYIFFIIEKIMQIRRALKEKRHREMENEYASEIELGELHDEHDENSENSGEKNGSNLKLNLNLASKTVKTDTDPKKEITLNSNGINQSAATLLKAKGSFDQTDDDQTCLVIHANKDLKYISRYLPNNKCDESIDHHDHENEVEHRHQHRNRSMITPNAASSMKSNSIPNSAIAKLSGAVSGTANIKVDKQSNLDDDEAQLKLLETEHVAASVAMATAGVIVTDNTNTIPKNVCLCTISPTSTLPSNNTTNSTTTNNNSNEFVDTAKLGIEPGEFHAFLDLDSNEKTMNGIIKPETTPVSVLIKRGDSHSMKRHGHGNDKKLHHSHSHLPTSRLHSHSHSHMHGHSHLHNYKSTREKAHHDHHKLHEREISSVKLIAWMVIMGDGLHNFADGLAIGASFASSINTGVGTSIAVLFHELPHEIGDFAVLRKAGVSLKRAFIFNALSGILCFIGVVVGLLIGEFKQFSDWCLLFTAGVFLYISLVDMIPELSEDKEDVSLSNFFIQSVGILVGVGIMFLVALEEDTINRLFT